MYRLSNMMQGMCAVHMARLMQGAAARLLGGSRWEVERARVPAATVRSDAVLTLWQPEHEQRVVFGLRLGCALPATCMMWAPSKPCFMYIPPGHAAQAPPLGVLLTMALVAAAASPQPPPFCSCRRHFHLLCKACGPIVLHVAA